MLGLNAPDIAVLVAYFIGITLIGIWAARLVKNMGDFFMPRKFGKAMLVTHAFGTGTHSDQAVGVAAVKKHLTAIGNSFGIIIDKPILDLLNITKDTPLEVKTDGAGLIIRPLYDEMPGNGELEEIPPPPENANASPPAPDPSMSTREVVEQLTEQPNSACAACHATLINPLGYATESFDALGRFRTQQVLLDDEGNPTGTRPVDTASVPQVIPGDDTPSSGVADLASQILDSGELQACFARQYLRFTFGRPEDDALDGCSLQDLTTRLESGAPLSEVLRAIALRPEFKRRRID